jgi:hypothetical protein
MRERWRNCVERAIGPEFTPSDHGVDLRESKRADYLAKFPLELVDPGTKRGRGENRTTWQIATSAAKVNDSDDAALWVAYCAGMRGAKMLTWSKGLRAAVDLDVEKSDDEIVAGEEQQEAEVVVVIARGAWDRCRDQRGLPCAILEAAERAGNGDDACAAIQTLLTARGLPRERPA